MFTSVSNKFTSVLRTKVEFFSYTMSKSSKKGKKDSNNSKSEVCLPSPVTVGKDGIVRINVHAKPGAKFNQITDIGTDAIGVSISAPPVEGEANTELVKYLASVLNVKKSEISLDKGSRSREKVIAVCNMDKSVVMEKLNEELKDK